MLESIFDLPEYKPYAMRWNARLRAFTRYRRYYDGSIYSDSAFKLAHKLYAQTKALFSFIARTVDLDVALVPGIEDAWLLTEDAPTAIVEAQALLYTWSQWATEGDAWIEDGATLGEAMLKIVPDPAARTVRIERLKPDTCMVVKHFDPETGEIAPMAIIVDNSDYDSDGKQYEYAEVITPVEIRTYRNGAPFPYGGNPDRYPNPLGFVPVVQVRNDVESRPTFSGLLPQLDSLNELTSYINDIIGRHAEPIWALSGVEPADVPKDGGTLWFFDNENAKLQAVLAEIDVAGSLAFIETIKNEAKNNLPELAFDDLRAKDQIATETLRVQMFELHAKIWRMRRHYDSALVEAHIMAAVAAGISGNTLLAPLLAPHEINAKRPVLPINPLDAIRLEEAELALEQQRRISGGESLTAMAMGVGVNVAT